MKVKIFVNEDPLELENEINNFLEENDIATVSFHYIQGSVLMEYILEEDYHE